jgi:acyl transferase domain-containing protein
MPPKTIADADSKRVDKLTIDGIAANLDGVYEFDFEELLDTLTNREIHQIKLISGVRLGELNDALNAGDNDLIIAFAVIILRRRGKRIDEDMLWDAPAGTKILLDLDDRQEQQEDAGGPPAEAPATD